MNEFERYLSQFEDFELAFFWKYKLNTYMKSTQKEIMAYIKKRWLSEPEMKQLIETYSKKEFPVEEFRCPRCKSKKIITKKGSRFFPDHYGLNLRNIKNTCTVCGLIFEPEESTNASFFNKLKMNIYKLGDWIESHTPGN